MACHSPLPAYRSRLGGSVSLREPLDRDSSDDYEFLRLPCGNCLGCRHSRAREWAFRCHLELTSHSNACWATLTYDQDHVPLTLSKLAVADFLKRLRARIHPRRVRFFASGEYGEANGRPHYHAIIFGLPISDPAIAQSWTLGHVRVDPLTPAAISYVAGYTAKKAGRQLKGETFDHVDEYGELHTVLYQPPFIVMSRKPGIGSDHRKHFNSWRSFAVHNGNKIPVPRYLHEAWLQNTTPLQHQQLLTEKLLNPRPLVTPANLDAARLDAITRLSHKKLKRPL